MIGCAMFEQREHMLGVVAARMKPPAQARRQLRVDEKSHSAAAAVTTG